MMNERKHKHNLLSAIVTCCCIHVVVINLIKRQKEEIGKAKSEAVREFAEKLKEHCNEITNQEWNKKTSPVSWAAAYESFVDDIDRLVEEME